MKMDRIDLHLHSTFSDGSDTPDELLEKAVRMGLRAISITDHDSTGAYTQSFMEECNSTPVTLLTGVELSTRDEGTELHVLGYGFDPARLDIASRSGKDRDRRNRAILEKLSELGIVITMEELKKRKPVGSIGRPLIAAVLVERGLFKDSFEAFDTLLAEGKSCYIPRELFTLASAAETIHSAGGKAVLAHPLQYRFSDEKLSSLFSHCAACGYYGVEVYYSGYRPEDIEKLSRFAALYGLMLTGGSDYHGISRPERTFGGASVPASLLEGLL